MSSATERGNSRELIEQAALRACRAFLIPVARFLLRQGIGYSVFSEQVKWAFVKVAGSEYGIRGRETTISRIVRLTGLPRREVKRLRSIDEADGDSIGSWWRHLGDILQRWHTDAAFLDANGNPIDLSANGKGGFSELVARFGGRMSPAVALHDLRRLGCVTELADGRIRVCARSIVPPGGNAESVHHFGETLANLAATMVHNFDSNRVEPPFVEKFVWADGLPRPAQARFRRICADQGYKFLEAMDDWLSSNCDPSEVSETEFLSVGVGIYYFEKSERDLGSVD